jgi:hypothetical protein
MGELEDQFTRNFRSTYTRSTSIEEVKSCIQKNGETLHSYIQWWSIIKNSAENVSDEQAIYAFAFGLRHLDLIEELGRIRPKIVSELTDSRILRNQVSAGYKRSNEEGGEHKSREYHKKDNSRGDKSRYFDPSAEDILNGPCRIHYAYLDGKRVSNHLMRNCRTFVKL